MRDTWYWYEISQAGGFTVWPAHDVGIMPRCKTLQYQYRLSFAPTVHDRRKFCPGGPAKKLSGRGPVITPMYQVPVTTEYIL